MPRTVGSRLLTVGDVVSDRYRVERSLEHDDSTELYAVADLERERFVALKTPARSHVTSDQLIARFHREREFSQRFEHPNVLRVESVFETRLAGLEEPVLCMLFELIEGASLADRIAAGPMAEEEALPIACQLAEALAASHRAGVVHRDLKPESVILATLGDGAVRAVLTELGVACGTAENVAESHNDSLTATNVVLGTPVYMAPEQLEEQKATPSSDLYALGLILFEMVTGRLPFMAPSTLQSIFKRVREDPPSPRLYASSLSRRWERAILRSLARDPNERFADGDALARALRGEDGDAADGDVPSDGRLRRWLRALVSEDSNTD